jgi:stringent starvation protein B
MADTPILPPKKEVAEVLLEGPSVFVHLDPRRDGVIVPKWFKNQPQLVLQIGLNMAVPIPDLLVDDDGISCTLSFNRAPYKCFLPWPAVYALIGEDGRAMIWPDDVPPELAAQLERAKLKAVPAKKAKKRTRPRAVPTESEAPKNAPAPETEKPEPGKRALPPYLRVIK